MSKLFKHVLVPVDFSENAELAMRTALEYFGNKADLITMLTVFEGAPKSMTNDDPNNEIDSMMSKSANIEMTRFKRLFEAESAELKAEVKPLIRKGNPAAEIIDLAKTTRVDLIIMGSQGRSSFAKAFFGGTTYQVSRKAHCSVMVMRG